MTTKLILTISIAMLLMSRVVTVESMWLFQLQQQQPETVGSISNQSTVADQLLAQQITSQLQVPTQTEPQQQEQVQTGLDPPASSYANYGSNLLSIAGIQPSSIASLLNAVGDTGFRYFNIQDQCRNRAACDLGYMLYKKLSFVHNWLIRTSVRTLTDMNNVYTQSWMEGMLGRNCTAIYMLCRQSPLEGLMNLSLLQHLAT